MTLSGFTSCRAKTSGLRRMSATAATRDLLVLVVPAQPHTGRGTLLLASSASSRAVESKEAMPTLGHAENM